MPVLAAYCGTIILSFDFPRHVKSIPEYPAECIVLDTDDDTWSNRRISIRFDFPQVYSRVITCLGFVNGSPDR